VFLDALPIILIPNSKHKPMKKQQYVVYIVDALKAFVPMLAKFDVLKVNIYFEEISKFFCSHPWSPSVPHK